MAVTQTRQALSLSLQGACLTERKKGERVRDRKKAIERQVEYKKKIDHGREQQNMTHTKIRKKR